MKCGVYDSYCPCGSESGQSGWPRRRWRNLQRKQNAVKQHKHGITKEELP
jgi:hypothetical protein